MIMDKKESLKFLDECLERLKNASQDELDKINAAYDKECNNIIESQIEFIEPIEILTEIESYNKYGEISLSTNDIIENEYKKRIKYGLNNDSKNIVYYEASVA